MSQFSIASAVILPVVLTLGACATIVGSPTQTIPIASTPSDAAIKVADETGAEVFKGATPTSVTLPKSTGRYWGKKSYTVTIEKPGFKPQTIPITASPNGWYLAGNFLFGGLIGWFIVDPLNGHMYTLAPGSVAAAIAEDVALHNNKAQDGSIAIMLIEDVPLALRDKLVRLQ